jgi:hypothetical protein
VAFIEASQELKQDLEQTKPKDWSQEIREESEDGNKEIIYWKRSGYNCFGVRDEAFIIAAETPDAFTIYIKHPENFFRGEANPKFVVSIGGGGLLILDKKDRHLGDFSLPQRAAIELWSQPGTAEHALIEKIIEPKKHSPNGLILTIPKDNTKNSLYYWWHRKPFQYYDNSVEDEPGYQPSPPPLFLGKLNSALKVLSDWFRGE